MLSCNTSNSSTSTLPRIQKKPKKTNNDDEAGPSGLQDVQLNLGFRDRTQDRRKERKKVKSKSRVANASKGRDESDRSPRERKVPQQTRKVSQQIGKVSQQTGKVSQQSGKVSQQSGKPSQQTGKNSQQTGKNSQHAFAVR